MDGGVYELLTKTFTIMINMGHCRFENTYLALCECYDAMMDYSEVSETEREYAKKLKEKCQEFIDDFNF